MGTSSMRTARPPSELEASERQGICQETRHSSGGRYDAATTSVTVVVLVEGCLLNGDQVRGMEAAGRQGMAATADVSAATTTLAVVLILCCCGFCRCLSDASMILAA